MFIRQFAYLVALAREKHFARAAAACNVTQPTLSAGIQKLERELGLPVIERSHQFLGLTPEGERVLSWAHRIIADFNGLKQDLANFGSGLSGTLKLGAIPAALPSVSLLTGPFCSRNPGVAVQLQSLTSKTIQRGLDTFEIDAALTYLEDEALKNVRSVPLYRDTSVFVIGPIANANRPIPPSQTEISWAEAAAYPLCLLTPDMQNRRIINQIFQELGIVPEPRLEVNSFDGITSHVRRGDWCSILPYTYCHIIGNDGIQAIPLVRPLRTQSIGLVTADRDPLPPVAQAFVHFASAMNIDRDLGY
jgi:DNA-binding transcriptional LysR family regulator